MVGTDSSEPVPFVDFHADYVSHGEATIAAMVKVAESGQFILGSAVKELEQELSQFVRNDTSDNLVYCVGVSDGTAALQLCLMALDIGIGDEVITTPFTWISTAEVIPLVGATPVFADIEADTYLINPKKIAPLLSKKTRAVLAVSLYGFMPDFKAIRKILDEAEGRFGTKIALIDDAAQSFGATRYEDRSCGSQYVTMSTTSFFPTKPLGGYGDGGAVFTKSEELANMVRALRVHGKENGRFMRVGLNSRLDTLQAAVVLTKLKVFPEQLEARQIAANRYTTLLKHDSRVITPVYERVVQEDKTAKSAFGVYTIGVQQRDKVLKKLKEKGVGCAAYYPICCHKQPMFSEILKGTNLTDLVVAEKASTCVMALPLHAYISEDVQHRVVNELFAALDEFNITEPPQLSF